MVTVIAVVGGTHGYSDSRGWEESLVTVPVEGRETPGYCDSRGYQEPISWLRGKSLDTVQILSTALHRFPFYYFSILACCERRALILSRTRVEKKHFWLYTST
jgi:hypothetical protein